MKNSQKPFRLDEYKQEINKQREKIETPEEEIEDQKNRNFSNTLILQNLGKGTKEKVLEDTIDVLASKIMKIVPDPNFQKTNCTIYHIERALRQPVSSNSKSRYKTPVLTV